MRRKALEVLGAQDNGTRWEMVLQCGFGYSLMFTKGLSAAQREQHCNCERSQVSLAAATAWKTFGVPLISDAAPRRLQTGPGVPLSSR